MRYEDWDALIFPACGDGLNVPLREFKVNCHGVVTESASTVSHAALKRGHVMPVMTCFIPSLDQGTNFQISVHSWTTAKFKFTPTHGVANPPQVWQIRVIVDGICKCIEVHDADCNWPRCMVNENTQSHWPNGTLQPLRFPRYLPDTAKHNHWHAADEAGRIKIEVTEGYISKVDGIRTFVKLADHVHFNFQPAPLDVLQQAGVAWPNTAMWKSATRPLPASAPLQRHDSVHNYCSIGPYSSPASLNIPNPPPPTPTDVRDSEKQHQDPVNLWDTGTRSTSSYSSIPYSVATFAAQDDDESHAFDRSGPGAQQPREIKVRIPSDQLHQILNALGSPPLPSHTTALQQSDTLSMPPPPLPQHVTNASSHARSDPSLAARSLGMTAELNPFSDRRDEARSSASDISMHATCTSYPECISQDEDGNLIHDCQDPVVCGRKEGVSDNLSASMTELLAHNVLTFPDRDSMSRQEDTATAMDLEYSRDSATDIPADMATYDDDVGSEPRPHAESFGSLTSSSPAEGAVAKKRGRVTLKTKATGGTANEKIKKEVDVAKPPRKVSRTSNRDKENLADGEKPTAMRFDN